MFLRWYFIIRGFLKTCACSSHEEGQFFFYLAANVTSGFGGFVCMIWHYQLSYILEKLPVLIFLLIMNIIGFLFFISYPFQFSETMGSNRTSLFLLCCCSLFCSFIHLHFPHLIHSCPFCFHTFSSSFSILHPRHLLPSICHSIHSPTPSGKILRKSSRRVTEWKQQEMRVQK